MKRKREPTFTNNEKRNLILLVEKHFEIIECKKTDALSSRAKHNEWLLIANQFNSITDHIPRDASSLKTLWDNLKKKAKQSMTVINSNRYATGGGPSNEPKEDSNIDKVISLIKTNVEGFSNIYDSDVALLDNNEDCDESLNLPISEVDLDNHVNKEHDHNKESAAEVPINGDWTNYTPALLRTPRAKVLVENFDYQIVEEAGEEVSSSPSSATTKTERPQKMEKLENKPPLKSTIRSSRHMTNRRRPVLKESEAVVLATTKIETLKSTVEQAKQQHEVVMRCLLLQEEQEKEKLKQEQEKTEQEVIRKKILLVELEKITNNSFPNEM
ncbi:myb/SANT-like DNA-binding domain-containing protein 3 [Macrosteles quadrilineatus]|uniref:myb/SANT-like DNA-binding domain-containing protein 3 n=1 Tax=Macrosteles quadrilineatus TaxID=74068 RepID=UPI0023E0BA13|nr:myb/SANT-like DNA-binding domain-containing protein 3 [Macrosteles quadrilineatus]